MSIENLSSLAALAGVCIAAVNIVVEVLKSFWLKEETSVPPAVLVVSEVVTFFVMYAYSVIENVKFSAMMGLGSFFGGFFIAYGAMFGYDKLYGQLFESIKNAMGGNE